MIQTPLERDSGFVVKPSLLSTARTDMPIKGRLTSIEDDIESMTKRIDALEERLKPEAKTVAAAVQESVEEKKSKSLTDVLGAFVKNKGTTNKKNKEKKAKSGVDRKLAQAVARDVSHRVAEEMAKQRQAQKRAAEDLEFDDDEELPGMSLLSTQGSESDDTLKYRITKDEADMAILKGRTRDLEGWLAGLTIVKADVAQVRRKLGDSLLSRIDSLEEDARVLGVKVSGIEHRLSRMEGSSAHAGDTPA